MDRRLGQRPRDESKGLKDEMDERREGDGG